MSRRKTKPAEAKHKAELRREKQTSEKKLPKNEISAKNMVLRPNACLARFNGRRRGF